MAEGALASAPAAEGADDGRGQAQGREQRRVASEEAGTEEEAGGNGGEGGGGADGGGGGGCSESGSGSAGGAEEAAEAAPQSSAALGDTAGLAAPVLSAALSGGAGDEDILRLGEGLDALVAGGGEEESFVQVPRYAMPNISSVLPEYSNMEQDTIRRCFGNANYDSLLRLPHKIDLNTINIARAEVMEDNRNGASQPFAPGGRSSKGTNVHGLFQEFNYQPSRFELADELASKDRVESEAKRQEVAGHDFVPAGHVVKEKYEDGFTAGARYPYMSDPYEASQDAMLRNKWIDDSKKLYGPFLVPGCDGDISAAPTKAGAREAMQVLSAVIHGEWEDAEVAVFPNEDEQWVVRFKLDTVDSEAGLVTFMNVLVRTDPIVLKYHLTKVVEHWNIKPGDGYMYFTLRPPWVKAMANATYYALHPEQRMGAKR